MQTTLRDAREDADMTQAALADAAGVSRGTVFNWETGRCAPAIGDAALGKMAVVLGVKPANLIV